MHYQIFLPGKRTGDGNHLAELGLNHLRGGEEYFETPSGPDGTGGMIVTWRLGNPRAPFGFRPDEQGWLEGDGYWAGFWKNPALSPVHLEKPPGVGGYAVVLGDDHEWIVPAIAELPKDIVFLKGSAQQVVKKRFEPFVEEASRWEKLLFDPAVEFECSEEQTDALIEFVLHALQLNYRLIPEVVTHLRLLTVHNLMECVQAVFHDPKRKELTDANAADENSVS